MSNYETLCQKIEKTYEAGVTVEEAESLAAEFLRAMLSVSVDLKNADIDARMRKTGVKALKAKVYLDSATAGEKKPSDVLLNAIVDTSDIVHGEQERLDDAEAQRDYLERMYNTFREAHVFYRGIAKGSFGS